MIEIGVLLLIVAAAGFGYLRGRLVERREGNRRLRTGAVTPGTVSDLSLADH